MFAKFGGTSNVRFRDHAPTVMLSLFVLGCAVLSGPSAFAQVLSAEQAVNQGTPGLSFQGIVQNSHLHAQTVAVTSTTVDVGSTVKMAHAKRLGVNLGSQAFYDSQQLQRNIMVRNPGFEGMMWQSILQCKTVTSTTCTDADQYTSWPASFFVGATAEFILGNSLGSQATVIASTAASKTANLGTMLTFSTPPAGMTAGDYVVVRMQTPGNAQAGWSTYTSGGASVSTELIDLSPLTLGHQALRVNASGVGQSASISSYADSSAGLSFVQMHGGYTISFRAKGTGGGNQVSINILRASANAPATRFFSQVVSLAPSWQDYSYRFQANDTGNVGAISLSLKESGSSMLIDDVALTADAGPGNPTVYRDEVVAALQGLHPGVLRFMDSGNSFGSSLDNLITPQLGRMRAGFSARVTTADDISMGLHDFLVLCQTIGAEPWYTFPAGSSTQDMSNFIDYFAGSASTVYGAKRAALGQTQPWTTVFPVIHLEFGNEVWNTGFIGETYNTPADYGKRGGILFAAARANPSYSAKSFDLILDGFAVLPYWNKNVLAASSNYDSIDVAPYLFNGFNDTSSVENIFGPMFAQPESMDSISSGIIAQQAQVAATAKRPAALAVYESNLSATSGTATQAQIDATVPSVAAGLTATEHMLLMMRDLGVTNQCMFALPGLNFNFTGTVAGAGTQSPLWGLALDMGGLTNRKRPSYLAEQMANAAILPTMLTTVQSGTNPTWNQPKSTNDNISMVGAHYIQTFAFTDGTQTNVILFNLHRTSALSVILSGANAPGGPANITTLTSASITDSNELGDNVEPTTTSQTLQSGSTVSLPPYSMTVLSYAANVSTAITGITASCVASNLYAGGSTSCSGSVNGTGSFNPGVTWSASQGTISNSGVYTAPASVTTSGVATITATAAGDTTKSTTAPISLTASSISNVAVICPSTSVAAGGTLSCAASVVGVGAFSSGVSWSSSSGTIDVNGNLTAPATGSSVTVTAISKQDTTQKGSIAISISSSAPPAPQGAPAPVISALTVAPGSTTAVITWTTNIKTTSGVDYGTTKSYGGTSPYNSKTATTASLTLTQLKSGTRYYVLAFSKDPTTGKSTSATTTFTTH